jgi:hypothetical protein
MSYNLGKHEEDNNIFTNKLLKDVGQTVCNWSGIENHIYPR